MARQIKDRVRTSVLSHILDVRSYDRPCACRLSYELHVNCNLTEHEVDSSNRFNATCLTPNKIVFSH